MNYDHNMEAFKDPENWKKNGGPFWIQSAQPIQPTFLQYGRISHGLVVLISWWILNGLQDLGTHLECMSTSKELHLDEIISEKSIINLSTFFITDIHKSLNYWNWIPISYVLMYSISKKVHTNKKGSSENIRTQYCDNILYEHKLFMLACCGQVVRV